MYSTLGLIVTAGVVSATSISPTTTYVTPPPIFDALSHTTWSRTSANSRIGDITVPFTNTDGNEDNIKMYRLDLVGDAHTKGYDHGYLLHREIIEFVDVKLNKYFMDMVLNLDFDTSQLPKPLQDIFEIIKIKGAIAAPQAFNKAMDWVYEHEEQYMPQYLIDEMNGIGEGICAGLKGSGLNEKCDLNAMQATVKRVNMLPELIRMACTAFGAWGKGSGSETGSLVQLRALDFGGGPFANYTVITTNRNENERSFASVSFPGFVGVITGISQDGIGISEKVWMTYDKYGLKPGSYDGIPDPFVLRAILQETKTRSEAENYMKNVNRTWG